MSIVRALRVYFTGGALSWKDSLLVAKTPRAFDAWCSWKWSIDCEPWLRQRLARSFNEEVKLLKRKV